MLIIEQDHISTDFFKQTEMSQMSRKKFPIHLLPCLLLDMYLQMMKTSY